MIEHPPKLWSQTFISCARRNSTIKCNRCQACLFILIYFNLIISPCLQEIDWYWTSKPAWTPVALKISPLTCDHVTFAQFASLAAAKHRPTNAYVNLMELHGLQELQSLSRAVDCLEACRCLWTVTLSQKGSFHFSLSCLNNFCIPFARRLAGEHFSRALLINEEQGVFRLLLQHCLSIVLDLHHGRSEPWQTRWF